MPVKIILKVSYGSYVIKISVNFKEKNITLSEGIMLILDSKLLKKLMKNLEFHYLFFE